MNIGDMIRYRDRLPTDPDPSAFPDNGFSWGEIGIITDLLKAKFRTNEYEPAIEYLDKNGDWTIARIDDVEVINEGI
jgi:hypothetical protein